MIFSDILNDPSGTHYYLGLDLGKHADYTAIAIVEFTSVTDGTRDPATYQLIRRPILALRHLECLPLRSTYPAIARHVNDLLLRPELKGRTTLIVDASGPGIPFLDFFAATRPPATLIKVLITASGEPHYSGGFHHVPRRTLFHNLAILFQNRVLKIASGLRHTSQLIMELRGIRADGRSSTEHDDFAIATALAAWQAAKGRWSTLPAARSTGAASGSNGTAPVLG